MAPASKKRKVVAIQERDDGKLSLQDFYSQEAMSGYKTITTRRVIIERGIENKPPFAEYIQSHGWQKLCESPLQANMNMAQEFYANMKFKDGDGFVLCRGKKVEISAAIINDFYGLASDTDLYADWQKLKDEVRVDNEGQLVGQWEEIVREVTRSECPLEEILSRDNWGSIDKKYLSMDMNVWYSFVAARLLPVSINSEVLWERLRMLYALKKNIAIDVGSEIYSSMLVMLPTTLGLGFHSLITALCHKAGCVDRLDDTFKKPMGMLTYVAFKRRAKQQPKSDARLGRLELEVAYIRSLCEHSAKILAHNYAETSNQFGGLPMAPVHQDEETEDVEDKQDPEDKEEDAE